MNTKIYLEIKVEADYSEDDHGVTVEGIYLHRAGRDSLRIDAYLTPQEREQACMNVMEYLDKQSSRKAALREDAALWRREAV